MKFYAIVNERLSDKVVNLIIDQIKSGNLRPGDKLPSEPELANALQVSRGVLREALTTLQARNIIYRKPKEGTFINTTALEILNESWSISMNRASYLDLIEVRECIEQRIVEKVIDLAKDEQIKELYDLITASDEDDYRFHFRLAEISHNIIFANFIDTYYDIFNKTPAIFPKNPSTESNIYNEHKAIVDAIKDRNKNEAKARVCEHLHMVKESFRACDSKIIY